MRPLRHTLLLVLSLAALAPALRAQDVQFVTTTQLDLEGLGVLGRLVDKAIETTTYQQGDVRRQDVDRSSTLIDLPGRRFVTLDHKRKRYSVLTFDEMAARLAEATGQASAKADASSDADFSFDVSYRLTGEQEAVGGFPARQGVLTIRTDYAVTGEDDAGKQATARGSFYTVADVWTSDRVAGMEAVEAFDRKLAEAMAGVVEAGAPNMMAALGAALQQDARLGAAMRRAAEEMAKVEGYPVRTTTYFVTVPEGQKLDVDALLAPKPAEKKRGGLGGLVRMAKNAAGAQDGEATQQVLVKTTTELTGVQQTPLEAALFRIPDGYQEEKP